MFKEKGHQTQTQTKVKGTFFVEDETLLELVEERPSPRNVGWICSFKKHQHSTPL